MKEGTRSLFTTFTKLTFVIVIICGYPTFEDSSSRRCCYLPWSEKFLSAAYLVSRSSSLDTSAISNPSSVLHQEIHQRYCVLFLFNLFTYFDFRCARGAFDRSVVTRKLATGVIETATDLIRLLGEPGNSSGYNIDVEIYNQDRGRDGEGCPEMIKTIAAAGENAPEIGAGFGLISFVCDTVEFKAEAAG
jgi:hypothetical protein